MFLQDICMCFYKCLLHYTNMGKNLIPLLLTSSIYQIRSSSAEARWINQELEVTREIPRQENSKLMKARIAVKAAKSWRL